MMRRLTVLFCVSITLCCLLLFFATPAFPSQRTLANSPPLNNTLHSAITNRQIPAAPSFPPIEMATDTHHQRSRVQSARDLSWQWRAWQLLPPMLQAKVDPRILAELRGEVLPAHLGGAYQQQLQPQPTVPLAQTRFLIYLAQQPDLKQLNDQVFASQTAQRNAVVQTLLRQTQTEQAALRSFLDRGQQEGLVQGYQPFFLVNAMAVDGGLDLILELVQRTDVVRLVANYPLQAVDAIDGRTATQRSGPSLPGTTESPFASAAVTASTLDGSNWNIELVGADRVWEEFELRGEGAVVAGFDTGVNFRHPALVARYRGYRGNNRFDHHYNWFEPDGNLYPNGDLGPSISQEPVTCGSHGTHTMGTMVGDGTVAGTQTGMAPGAMWIALPGICGNTMGGGIRDNIGGIKAFQWLLCPTDLSGSLATADCSKAPDVVNNSWGSANPTGETFRPWIQALRAANIAPVFAAGNPNTTNGSIGSPANAPEAITVGATDRNDRVATFSGRGPSFYPNEQKPELSAPGVDVKSTTTHSDYGLSSGTSMAAPHVAGLIALMVAADLRDGVRDFSVDELEAFMQSTAVDLGPGGADPDYGFGRIDAYNAVRLVLNAGDLRGVVRDVQSAAPIVGATISGVEAIHFVAQTNAEGHYSITVPAGVYQLQVDAWGYRSATFPNQYVLANSLSVADIALESLPQVTVQGTVRGAAGLLVGAELYVDAMPAVRTTTDTSGRFQLTLPVGVHRLVAEKVGYRRTETLVTIDEDVAESVNGESVNIIIEQAPSILLVEADIYRGWFGGWPIGEFFRSAMEEEGYRYTSWPIESIGHTDTISHTDGSVLYGIPSPATLAQYDLVIWAQSACNSGAQGCFIASSPTPLGASETLSQYMDQGGRLILSGQDLGFWEDGAPLFTDYLHAALAADRVATTGATLTGNAFLSNIALTLTNASLYGYANGSLQLAPDAVVAENDAPAVYPILTYDDSQLPAALAIAPCEADYRAVYFAMGYENIGVRGRTRDAAIAATLERSIAWVTGDRRAMDIELVAEKTARFGEPGDLVRYPVQLINTGRQPLTVQLAPSGNQWPVALQWEAAADNRSVELAPCTTIDLVVVTTLPPSAQQDATDTLTLTLTVLGEGGTPQPALTQRVQLVTTVFANWAEGVRMPTPRYQHAAAALAGIPGQSASQLYVIGGWRGTAGNGSGNDTAVATNERFDSCTGRWTSLAALPEPRAAASVAALNGDLYLVGGNMPVVSTLGRTVQPFANLWRYEVAADRWHELAPLPVALSGAAAAAWGNSIYLFGGADIFGTLHNLSFRYDPATDSWHELEPIPGPGRLFAAAVSQGDELLLIGGYPALTLVHRYDPQRDLWQEGPSLRQGRHSFGLAKTPAGDLYAAGGAIGDTGIGTVERLVGGVRSPNTPWRLMPELQVVHRYGASAAYLDGQIMVVGGAGSQGASETLAVDMNFCRSTLEAMQSVIGVGKPLLYTIQLQSGTVALPAARLQNTLPPATRFVDFVENPLNARYDDATHTIEWTGALAPNVLPPPIRYRLVADDPQLVSGTRLTNTITFAHGDELAFTRRVAVSLLSTELSNSYKQVDQAWARSGDLLTYTINIQGDSYVSNTVTVRDPLPPLISYVPNSLRYGNGRGGYDEASRTIWWEGSTVAAGTPFANVEDRYLWGDSTGDGHFSVPYRWVEIKDTGTVIGNGDDQYFCELPIGFLFPFYGNTETSFCASTNGFLSFDPFGDSGENQPICPLPDRTGNRGLIAAIWDDLIVNDAIYYQTFGSAPQRYLVVQWQGARRFGALSNQSTNFQIVLFEDGLIQVAIDEVGGLRGVSSITGIADMNRTLGTTYACDQPGSLQDQLAITFLPPGNTIGVAQSSIRFQARINPIASDEGNDSKGSGTLNVPLTNTVYISATPPSLADGPLVRHATTLLNPLDLGLSRFVADREEAIPQEIVTFQLRLRNTGLISATGASAIVELPKPLVYVLDSLQCEVGTCTVNGARIEWQGVIPPRSAAQQSAIVVQFAARLDRALPDRTPLTVEAQMDDGFGNLSARQVTLLARRADLSQSQIQFRPRFGEPGTTALLIALLQNVGKVATTGEATIVLPTQFTVVDGSLHCGTGQCTIDNGVVHWLGEVAPRELVPIQVQMAIPADADFGSRYMATLTVNDLAWVEQFSSEAEFQVRHTYLLPAIFGVKAPYRLYLPLIVADR